MRKKRVTKTQANRTDWAHSYLWQASKDIRHAKDQFLENDIGGCLQNVEFAIQQLEAAKTKLMKLSCVIVKDLNA